MSVQYELIYIFVKAAQPERLFTFLPAADFCSRGRNQADSKHFKNLDKRERIKRRLKRTDAVSASAFRYISPIQT